MKFALIIIFSIISVLLHAQEIKVSDEINMRQDNEILLLGKFNENLLFYRDQYPEYQIQAVDQNMHFLWEKPIKVGKKRSKIITAFGDGRYFYTISREKIKKKTNLRIFKFNAKAKVLDSLSIYIKGQTNYLLGTQYVMSEDKSYVLLYTEIGPQQELRGFLLDLQEYKVVWISQFKGLHAKYGNNPYFFEVTNSGMVYFIQSNHNKKSKRNPHFYNIYKFVSNKTPKPTSFSLEGKQTYDVMFKYDNINKQLLGAGLYSENNLSSANGTFYMRNSEGDNKLTFHEFEIGFVKEFMDKKRFVRSRVTDTYVKDLVLRQDGGLLMINERILNQNNYNRNLPHQADFILKSNDYSFLDLFITSFHPNGEVHWKKIIHKKQYSYNDSGSYSSYFLAKTPSELHIIFNDDIKTETTASDYKINIVGKAKRSSLLNTKYHNLRLLITESLQVGSSEIIIPSLDRKILKLVKVKW